MGVKGKVFSAGSDELVGELVVDGVPFEPDDLSSCELLDDPPYVISSSTMTATIEDVDEDLVRKLSGWTVLIAEMPETHNKVLSRIYTWDFEKMRRDGTNEIVVHPPSLILTPDVPNPWRVISAWLNVDEAPGGDFAYVRNDEPDVLRVASALDASWGIGRYFMEHDL